MENSFLKYNPARELDTVDRDLEINRDPGGDCGSERRQRRKGEREVEKGEKLGEAKAQRWEEEGEGARWGSARWEERGRQEEGDRRACGGGGRERAKGDRRAASQASGWGR